MYLNLKSLIDRTMFLFLDKFSCILTFTANIEDQSEYAAP